MMKFCCEDMELEVKKDVNDFYAGKNVAYEPFNRSFYVYHAGDSRHGTCIDYCPFCGAKLPKELIDEREEIIRTELGLSYLPGDYGESPEKELPEEFKTDEWWKKRGL
jgi:hypothetical protein